MKHEFLEFLTHKEHPPKGLSELTRRDVLLSFHSKSIISRFVFFQFLGALFSMSVCPQFGIGFVEGHGITHIFRMISDMACAAFCGSLFFSSGAVMAFIGMKGEELWWVWRRFKISLIILPTIAWSILMLGNMSLQLDSESMSYHLVWLATAIGAEMIFMQLRSRLYLQKVSL